MSTPLYRRRSDAAGRPYLETDLPGALVVRHPLLNKGAAFDAEERQAFGLDGMLPPHVATLEEQVARAEANLRGFDDPLDAHVYLRVLQDRNEVLFYALLQRNLEEVLPLVYTPTVGRAAERFSHLHRQTRGLVVSTETIDRVEELLDNVPGPEVRLAVATDSEGVLGIGDQGFGGMAIGIGKLSLYTAAAGVDPGVTLPIELDVGTDRQDLLDDPLYLGVRHERLVGPAYDDFMERFVRAFTRRFPQALLQWEDFSRQKAFDLMDRYRNVLPSFNDDVQGTGAVVLAGLLAAARHRGRSLAEETIVVHGGGAGGVGVARQLQAGLRRAGLTADRARARVLVLDRHGLLVRGRGDVAAYQWSVAQDPERIAAWDAEGDVPDLRAIVREARATCLIGLSGQPGVFDRALVEALAENTDRPVVMPLSNPTDRAEAHPERVLEWTHGRARVATGSPFGEVRWQGRVVPVGQGNNAFVFPGVGLGAVLAGAHRISDDVLSAAAEALADFVAENDASGEALFPPVRELPAASARVAAGVLRAVHGEGAGTGPPPIDAEQCVAAHAWTPTYLPLRPAETPGQ